MEQIYVNSRISKISVLLKQLNNDKYDHNIQLICSFY